MTAFRVLVVDDEPLARTMVADLLRGDAEIASVIECENGTHVKDAVARHHPHIVFLDIEMPEIDGIEIAGSLSGEDPVIVFVTAFSHYATQAFDVRGIDYILKPFSDSRFKEAVERAKRRVREKRLGELAAQGVLAPSRPEDAIAEPTPSPATGWLERLSLKEGDHAVVLKSTDIVWIEAQDYYVRIHSKRGRHLVRATLASLEERLNPQMFVRVHRAAIVNLEEVQNIHDRDGMHLTLSDGAQISVSRAKRRRIDAVLNPRLRSR